MVEVERVEFRAIDLLSNGKGWFGIVRIGFCGTEVLGARLVAEIEGSQVDVDALVEAINEAAWTGRTSNLYQLIGGLPSAMIFSLATAVGEGPDPTSLVLSDSGRPLVELSESWAHGARGLHELVDSAVAAMDSFKLGVITNSADLVATDRFCMRLYASDVQALRSKWQRRLPQPEVGRVVERKFTDDPHQEISDPRWGTVHARLYSLIVLDDNDQDAPGTVEWVVEYTDAPLVDPSEEHRFVLDDQQPSASGALTPRNRYHLWGGLLAILADLSQIDNRKQLEATVLHRRMPHVVQCQTLAWWRTFARSARRLAEAARRGDTAGLEPRTIAEDVLLFLASRGEFADAGAQASEFLEQHDLSDGLPQHHEDGRLDDLLDQLASVRNVIPTLDELFVVAPSRGRVIPAMSELGPRRVHAWHRLRGAH